MSGNTLETAIDTLRGMLQDGGPYTLSRSEVEQIVVCNRNQEVMIERALARVRELEHERDRAVSAVCALQTRIRELEAERTHQSQEGTCFSWPELVELLRGDIAERDARIRELERKVEQWRATAMNPLLPMPDDGDEFSEHNRRVALEKRVSELEAFRAKVDVIRCDFVNKNPASAAMEAIECLLDETENR